MKKFFDTNHFLASNVAVLGVVLTIVSVMIGMFPRSLLDNEGGLASSSIYYTKNKGENSLPVLYSPSALCVSQTIELVLLFPINNLFNPSNSSAIKVYL